MVSSRKRAKQFSLAVTTRLWRGHISAVKAMHPLWFMVKQDSPSLVSFLSPDLIFLFNLVYLSHMLSPAKKRNLIRYWQETSDENFRTMLSLYRSKRYAACLFFGHLILEKGLKILVIQSSQDFPPKIHDLLKLSKLAGVELTKDQVDLLEDVNEFNMEARYPEVKYQFYKKCTKTFVDRYYDRIRHFYQQLCQKMP